MWLAIIWMCQNLLNSAPTVGCFFPIFLALKDQKELRVIFLVSKWHSNDSHCAMKYLVI